MNTSKMAASIGSLVVSVSSKGMRLRKGPHRGGTQACGGINTSKKQRGYPPAFLSSFRIGSGCTDPQIFTQSIADARLVFEMGAELGYKMRLLDIGGGFPGAEEAKGHFEEVQGYPSIPFLIQETVGCGGRSGAQW